MGSVGGGPTLVWRSCTLCSKSRQFRRLFLPPLHPPLSLIFWLAYVMHIARTACTMRCVVPLLAGTQLQWWVNGILGSARGPTPPLSVGSTPFSDITQVPQTTSRFNPCAGKKYEQSGKALSIYVSPSVSPSPPSRLSLVSRFYCI